MRSLRLSVLLLGLLAFAGWAGVGFLMFRDAGTQTAFEVFVREPAPAWEDYTFSVDAGLDLDELDRQAGCLWEFMRAEGIEVTLENVFVVGDYSDVRGGACRLIGEDDE